LDRDEVWFGVLLGRSAGATRSRAPSWSLPVCHVSCIVRFRLSGPYPDPAVH
jgi:hypothetical protein